MPVGQQHRIIVVEDEPATRKLLQRQLSSAGYDVTAYTDGRAALDPITAMNSGIVLADWSMPEMDGLQLCGAIRELEAMQALGNIYFILLTANDSKEQTIAGLDAGANDYLTKPYHQGELLARIQVGARMLKLQEELLQRTIEFQKANTQMAILTRRLEELANTDTLTGLANRRCLFDRFADLWQLAARHGHPLSCVMFDVDRFKLTNDSFGHDAGDQVLREVADALRESARRPDLCGRLGGEEFVIICPATPRDGAAALAERVRARLSAATIPYNGRILHVTVSCGVAERTDATSSPEDLLREADTMLYRAKASGRNQTWVTTADGGERVAPVLVAE
jgi:diguanylate cyclase (GGDEF)-like protein